MKKRIAVLIILCLAMVAVLVSCEEEKEPLEKEYTATCLVENSDYTEIISLKEGERFKCTVPSKEHYTFLYYADEYGVAYTDEKGYSLEAFSGDHDLVLTAKWQGDEILVRLNTDDGELSGEDYYFIEYGSLLPNPEIPEKEHYQFVGWYGISNEGSSFLVHDGIRLVNPKLTITDDNFYINNNELTLTARYSTDKVKVTCIYEDNTAKEETVIEVPYGAKVKDCNMPTILNQYNKIQGFVWSKDDDFEADEYLERIKEPITLYAVAMETEYFGYKARQSFDLSKLMVDFRTTNKTDVNDTYTTASGTKEVIFVGNPSVVYTNFSIVVSATVEDLKITFIDFNYVGRSGSPAFDASKLSNDSVLVLNAKGNSSIKGADGSNGANGKSHKRDEAVKNKTAENGGKGNAGATGQTALYANTIKINIDQSGSLSLYGGNGGKGGNGGDGEGSKNKGIAQSGHGGAGGNGGNGGDGLHICGTLSLESKGRFYTCGGSGGNGGNGGSGGNYCDKAATDRADNGGNGGKGGNGGTGGHGANAEDYASISTTEWTTAFSVGGNGGNGGNGGDGGASGKNEFQTVGGTPGAAGSKGTGGNMGYALNNCTFDINVTNGNNGADGSNGLAGKKS